VKRTVFVFAAISAFATGCGSHGPEQQSKKPPGYPQGTQLVVLEPETAISKLETSDERATYLSQLANDSKFDPKEHVPMLEKYAGDANQEVAGKAKELLTRVQ
jgi:hypothetical protein